MELVELAEEDFRQTTRGHHGAGLAVVTLLVVVAATTDHVVDQGEEVSTHHLLTAGR